MGRAGTFRRAELARQYWQRWFEVEVAHLFNREGLDLLGQPP
jgi:hypothetical protein